MQTQIRQTAGQFLENDRQLKPRQRSAESEVSTEPEGQVGPCIAASYVQRLGPVENRFIPVARREIQQQVRTRRYSGARDFDRNPGLAAPGDHRRPVPDQLLHRRANTPRVRRDAGCARAETFREAVTDFDINELYRLVQVSGRRRRDSAPGTRREVVRPISTSVRMRPWAARQGHPSRPACG